MDLLPLLPLQHSILDLDLDEEPEDYDGVSDLGDTEPLYSDLEAAEESVITINQKRKKYQCEQCSYATKSRGHIKRHRKTVHRLDPYFYCDHCSYKSERKGNIASHMRHKHLPKHIKCEYENCKYATNDPKLIQIHIDQVHLEIKNFNCDHCEFRCARKDNLTSHMKHNHLPRNLKCEFKDCLFATNIPREIQRHVDQVHLQIKPFSCDLCNYTAARRDNLASHQSRVHLRALYEDPTLVKKEKVKNDLEEKYSYLKSKNRKIKKIKGKDRRKMDNLTMEENDLTSNSIDTSKDVKLNMKLRAENPEVPLDSSMVPFQCPYCKLNYMVNKEILEFVKCKKCYQNKNHEVQTHGKNELKSED